MIKGKRHGEPIDIQHLISKDRSIHCHGSRASIQSAERGITDTETPPVPAASNKRKDRTRSNTSSVWQGKFFDAGSIAGVRKFCEAGLGEVAFRRPQTNHPKLSVSYVQQKPFDCKVVQKRRVNGMVCGICVCARTSRC